MSSHYSEDDLTLYYYGEGPYSARGSWLVAPGSWLGARGRGPRSEEGPGGRGPGSEVVRHLQTCAACAALYRDISSTLAMVVADEVPQRGDQYGLEVWQRIRHRLPEQDESGFAGFTGYGLRGLRWDRLALAGAAAVLVGAAFIAGRTWHRPAATPAAANLANSTNPANPENLANPANLTNSDAARERILLTSVADHLDRSGRVLTDIMNAQEPSDISAEQRWADDLVTTSRLYRQDAVDAGEQSVATVLDDLERNLLEIVHSPSKISAADLEQIRRRIDAAALLFKVRIMSDELRQREAAPAGRSTPRTPTSTIS